MVITTHRPLYVASSSFYRSGYNRSPFENTCVTVRLQRLNDEDVKTLVKRTLDGNQIQFSDQDIRFISHLSGNYPFLAQMAGSMP